MRWLGVASLCLAVAISSCGVRNGNQQTVSPPTSILGTAASVCSGDEITTSVRFATCDELGPWIDEVFVDLDGSGSDPSRTEALDLVLSICAEAATPDGGASSATESSLSAELVKRIKNQVCLL